MSDAACVSLSKGDPQQTEFPVDDAVGPTARFAWITSIIKYYPSSWLPLRRRPLFDLLDWPFRADETACPILG